MPQPWLHEYNNERPHESLNNLTPEEYRLMAENPETSKSVELKRVRIQLLRTKHSLQQQKDLAWMCGDFSARRRESLADITRCFSQRSPAFAEDDEGKSGLRVVNTA